MATVALTYTALPSGPIKLAITSVIVSTLVIALTKWNIFYTECQADDGSSCVRKLRGFGPGDDETIFPAWMAITGFAYIIYFLSMASSIMAPETPAFYY